jgi:hypothetical protein
MQFRTRVLKSLHGFSSSAKLYSVMYQDFAEKTLLVTPKLLDDKLNPLFLVLYLDATRFVSSADTSKY